MNDRFVIDDVEMRRSATWPGGPHVETRYPMADPEDPVDVLDESLTGTDPYAAPAAGPAR